MSNDKAREAYLSPHFLNLKGPRVFLDGEIEDLRRKTLIGQILVIQNQRKLLWRSTYKSRNNMDDI